MPTQPALTARQRQIYNLIGERIRACGYAPTLREIGAHLGIRSTNGVADHIKALRRKGYLLQSGGKSRTLCPIAAAARATQPPQLSATVAPMLRVPLLGDVAGGAPIFAPPAGAAEATEALEVDGRLVAAGSGLLYALRVRGNSMCDAGIGDADIIFVRHCQQAAHKQIIVALLGDEATVKRLMLHNQGITLCAANAAYKDIVLSAQQSSTLRIMGVVVGVFHRFEAF